MASVVGANTFTEQPKEKKYVAGEGWTTIRTWLGPRAQLDQFVVDVVAPKLPQNIDVSYGTPAIIKAEFAGLPDDDGSLDSGFPGSSDAVQEAEDNAVWELIPIQIDKPLATHPAFARSGQTPTVIEKIEKAIREGTATESDWDTDFGIANMNDYRNLRVKGTDSWRTWTWMIRKTIVIGRPVDLKAEEKNTQKIVQYGDIQVPDDVKWAQPEYRVWDGDVVTETKLIEEWMACPPVIRWTGKKYEVTREWLGAVAWYSILYEGGGASSEDAGI